MDDGAAPEVEEVLAGAAIASAASLPPADVGEGVLDGDAFAQLGAIGWRRLALPQLHQEPLVGMDRHAAAVGAGVVQRSRRGQAAQVCSGKRAVPPGANGSTAPLGQRIVRASPSSAKAALGKQPPLRTGRALQEITRSSARSRTRALLR
jgi:hypothetical protein